MATMTYTDRHVSGANEFFTGILRKAVDILTNVAERRILRDLSTLDAQTLNDLGLRREQLSANEGATYEILAHREIGDPGYRIARK